MNNSNLIDNQSFSERLSFFIKQKNLTVAEFERSCGLSRSVIHSAIKNIGAIGSDKLSKIFATYPELNTEWLLTGKGLMLKNIIPGEKTELVRISDNKTADIGKISVLPVYNQMATAGDVELLFHQDITEENTIYLPEIRGCDFGVKVYGDSMSGVIENGDIILVREVEQRLATNGKIHMIQTNDNLYVKYLYRSEAQYILTSENKFHAPIIVPSVSVVRLYEVVWNLRIKKM